MTGITPPEGSVEAVLLVQAAKREQAMLAETARLSAALDAMTERVEKAERERDEANIAFDGALAELSEALGMKHFTMVSAIAYVRGAVRERDEACARLSSMTERAEYAESEAAAHDAAATVYEHDIRELTARAEKAERERDEARSGIPQLDAWRNAIEAERDALRVRAKKAEARADKAERERDEACAQGIDHATEAVVCTYCCDHKVVPDGLSTALVPCPRCADQKVGTK